MITFYNVTDQIDHCSAHFTVEQPLNALDWVAIFNFLGIQYRSIEIYPGLLMGPASMYEQLKKFEGMLILPPKNETDEEWVNRKFREEF